MKSFSSILDKQKFKQEQKIDFFALASNLHTGRVQKKHDSICNGMLAMQADVCSKAERRRIKIPHHVGPRFLVTRLSQTVQVSRHYPNEICGVGHIVRRNCGSQKLLIQSPDLGIFCDESHSLVFHFFFLSLSLNSYKPNINKVYLADGIPTVLWIRRSMRLLG